MAGVSPWLYPGIETNTVGCSPVSHQDRLPVWPLTVLTKPSWTCFWLEGAAHP